MSSEAILFSFAWWKVMLAGLSTLAVFSFLYRENAFYRFFEHLFIGIATGWGVLFSIRNFLWPKVVKPLFGLDLVVFPDGTMSAPYNEANLLFLLPIGFGLLFYFILSKRRAWLAQLVIGFELGFAGGLAFKGVFTEMLPQIFDSFRPLYIAGSAADSAANIVFVFSLLAAMSYFFFTFRRAPGGLIERSSTVGRWIMMGCFGAFFGSTIMARMALLVERLDFLIHDWLPLFY